MKKLYAFVLLWTALVALSVCQAQTGRFHRVRVEISPERLEHLFNNGLEVDHFSYEDKKVFTGEVSDEDVALFRRNGVKVKYLIKDLVKNYQAIK
ncbi:hypothetical protein [Spirosoma arcticum]